jgi:uncharacterized protein (TIGR00369 family)
MMSLAEIAPGAPADFEGLRQDLRRRADGGITSTLGIDLVEMKDGHAVFVGTPGREVYNPIGMVHGGYAATLLDSACGCAVHTRLGPGEGYSTLELKVAYHKAITDGTGEVRADGRVVSLGRRVAFAEATLTDSAGRLLASATSTLLVMRP